MWCQAVNNSCTSCKKQTFWLFVGFYGDIAKWHWQILVLIAVFAPLLKHDGVIYNIFCKLFRAVVDKYVFELLLVKCWPFEESLVQPLRYTFCKSMNLTGIILFKISATVLFRCFLYLLEFLTSLFEFFTSQIGTATTEIQSGHLVVRAVSKQH